MKTTRVSIFLTLFLISTLYLPSTFAQDAAQWSLPDGAKARLGKGWMLGNFVYASDSKRLVIATSNGIWICDAESGAELSLLTLTAGDFTATRKMLIRK